MFKKSVTIGVLLFIAVAAVLVTPSTGDAQRYFTGYGVYQPYYLPHYGYYRPYYGFGFGNRLYYGYGQYYSPYFGGYYDYGYPGYYGTYPRYGYYPNNYLWR
jgi:hypothetical protein